MRREKTKFYTVAPVVFDNKAYNALQDNFGNIYTKKQVDELLNSLADFYSIENIDEEIDYTNNRNRLEQILKNYQANYSQEYKETSEGLFELPAPVHRYKKFNSEKRNWSCTCKWCNTTVSSKTDDGYFIINDNIFEMSLEHACSEVCSALIWKEKVKEWIYKHEYQQFFSL